MSDNEKMNEVLEFLKKRKSRTDEEILKEHLDENSTAEANAVAVPVGPYPRPIMVDKFPTGYGLAEPETMILTKMAGFPVACYSAWKSEDGSTNRLINRFHSGRKNFSGTCLLFGWENNAPAPFTTDQANIVCEILAKAKIRLDRGQL